MFLRAVITVGSTPTVLLPTDWSAVLDVVSNVMKDGSFGDRNHSCHEGTSSKPCFNRSQLLSSCFEAWLKYRPSVAKAAFSKVTTAVPSDPEKPEMYSSIISFRKHKGVCGSDLGGHHMVQYIQTDDCLQMEQLEEGE